MGCVSQGATFENGPPQDQQQQNQPTKAELLAQREDGSGGGNQPPGGGAGGAGGPAGSQNPGSYVGDLFLITKSTHTLEPHVEHPELKGLSAGAAHAGPNVELKPRNWAAQQNAALQAQLEGQATDMYHEDRPVIRYQTDMPTTLGRGWGPDGAEHPQEPGRWTGKLPDFYNADGTVKSGQQVKDDFSLPAKVPPTYVSTVNPAVGVEIEASRPISDKVRQYKLGSVIASWFSNKNSLG